MKAKTTVIAVKGCTKKTNDLYARLKTLCDKKGYKLKVKGPEALELGIREIFKQEE